MVLGFLNRVDPTDIVSNYYQESIIPLYYDVGMAVKTKYANKYEFYYSTLHCHTIIPT